MQSSTVVRLDAGKSYYVEGVASNADGLNSLSIGVQLPNGLLLRPIPGEFLNRLPMTAQPETKDGGGEGGPAPAASAPPPSPVAPPPPPPPQAGPARGGGNGAWGGVGGGNVYGDKNSYNAAEILTTEQFTANPKLDSRGLKGAAKAAADKGYGNAEVLTSQQFSPLMAPAPIPNAPASIGPAPGPAPAPAPVAVAASPASIGPDPAPAPAPAPVSTAVGEDLENLLGGLGLGSLSGVTTPAEATTNAAPTGFNFPVSSPPGTL